MWEHKAGEPSFLPPESGRSAEQSYFGRTGYRATNVGAREPVGPGLRRFTWPAIVLLVTLAAYLVSRLAAG